MEIYLPIIQATLAEWLQLTLDHPLYAAALAITVWLLMTLLYSIKVAGLNKKNTATERLRTDAEAKLNATEQQRQQIQDELTAITEQLAQAQQAADAEKQRLLASTHHIAQRNQQIASTIQGLASSFDIGERPLPVPDSGNADEVWQQHDNVIKQLIERLRTEQLAKMELEKFYQAEQAKLVEIEAHKLSLQANLDSQTALIASLQAQTTSLQQQQNDTQRDLTDTLKKHQADLARLLELEQQVAYITTTDTALPIAPAPADVKPSPAPTETLQNLFKKPAPIVAPTPIITTPEPEPIATPAPVIQPLIEAVSAPEPEPVIEKDSEEPVAIISTPEQQPSSVITDTLVVWVDEEVTKTAPVLPESLPEPEFAPTKVTIEPLINKERIDDSLEKTSKVSALKGLYKKFAPSKTVASEAKAVVVKPTPDANDEGQLKKLYQKFTSQKTPESEDIDDSNSLEDTADKITEKLEQFKGLYGKYFSKDKE